MPETGVDGEMAIAGKQGGWTWKGMACTGEIGEARRERGLVGLVTEEGMEHVEVESRLREKSRSKLAASISERDLELDVLECLHVGCVLGSNEFSGNEGSWESPWRRRRQTDAITAVNMSKIKSTSVGGFFSPSITSTSSASTRIRGQNSKRCAESRYQR